MQTQQTPRLAHDYFTFYQESAVFPEQLKFRRFGAEWAKKLYDDGEELFIMKEELNQGIAKIRTREGGNSLTTLSYPRNLLDRDGELHKKWTRYEERLRAYSKNLCLFNNLFKLPDPSTYSSRKLGEFPDLFANDTFGPTNEIHGATAYQDPASPDFVAVVGVDSSDVLTKLAIENIEWIDTKVLRRLRKWFRKNTPQTPGVRLSAVIGFMDAIACIFVPLLLTITMFALALIHPINVRIAVVGVFGLLFSGSAKFLSGRVSRSSIFSLTAAFFAVASVFVSTTDNSLCKGGQV
ncbi:hypothetical protein N0V90_012209 [Kalmusia sp. IMI 367209]|nr:hypothetical protein N0V90_012209 [Kalmusia sp. IMI 367209]